MCVFPSTKMSWAVAVLVALLLFLPTVVPSNEKADSLHNVEDQSDSTSPEESETIQEDELDAADVVLVLFSMLFLGLFARFAFHSIPIPYTALLLVFGILVGILQLYLTSPAGDPKDYYLSRGVDDQGTPLWKRFAQGVDMWEKIPPDFLLLVFLPALVFASAFSVNFHVTKRSLGQVLTLAGPGVFITTALTAVFVKYVFPYGWCWPKAITFGAMISITDPATVVTLLKQTGAKRLAFVLEGESLFQDGTAFVFFVLFKDLIPRTADCLNDKMNCGSGGYPGCNSEDNTFKPDDDFTEHSILDSIRIFFRLALLGPVIGFLFGLAATYWIEHIYDDLLTEISITFVSSYLAFYVAEKVFETSGVLTVVALGLYMGSFAKARISSSVYEPMQAFWEIVDYIASTLIFIFTGLKIAIVLAEDEYTNDVWITWKEWMYAILLYVVLYAIRTITLAVLCPVLKRMGDGITWQEVIVAVSSSLRGADTLALALIVQLDADNMPPSFRSYTIFYVSFVVSATLLFRGSSILPILTWLGFTKSSPEKRKILLPIVAEMEHVGTMKASEFEEDKFGYANYREIVNLTKVDINRIYPNREEALAPNQSLDPVPAIVDSSSRQARRPLLPTASDNVSSVYNPFRRKSKTPIPFQRKMDQEMRRRFYKAVKKSYAEQLQKGCVTPSEIFYLTESVGKGMDDCDKDICDWEHLEKMATPARWRFRIQKFKRDFRSNSRRSFFDILILKLLSYSLFEFVLMTRTLIDAHNQAEVILREHIDQETTQTEDSPADRSQEEEQRLKNSLHSVIEESREGRQKASQKLQDYRMHYPEIFSAIDNRLCALEILHVKRQYVKTTHHSGVIGRVEADELREMLDTNLRNLFHSSLFFELPSSRDLVARHSLLESLSSADFDREVVRKVYRGNFKEHEPIFESGSSPDYVTFLIRAGAKSIEEDGKEILIYQNPVTLVGITEVILNRRRSRTVTCCSQAEAWQLDQATFLGLMKNFESVRARSWQFAALLLTAQSPWGEFMGKTVAEFYGIFTRSKLVHYRKGDSLPEPLVAYLVEGRLSEYSLGRQSAKTINAPFPLQIEREKYIAETDITILDLQDSSVCGASPQAKAYMKRNITSVSSGPLPNVNAVQRSLTESSGLMTQSDRLSNRMAVSLDRISLDELAAGSECGTLEEPERVPSQELGQNPRLKVIGRVVRFAHSFNDRSKNVQ